MLMPYAPEPEEDRTMLTLNTTALDPRLTTRTTDTVEIFLHLDTMTPQ